MALDFPANPTNGQIFGSYVWSASKGVWQSREESAAPAVVSPVPPITPNSGDIWVDSSDGVSYVYYDDGSSGQWIEMISSGVPQLNTKANLDGGNTFTGTQTFNTPLGVSSGGTGTNTLSGYVFGNGTSAMVAQNGYLYVDTIYYTSNGTFSKASYPWLRGIKVKVVGGGGAGGGSQAASGGTGNTSFGMGGGAGGYAESFITDIAGLASSITVTRGAGGLGVSAGTGNTGGQSSFGSLVIATGGTGGGIKPNSIYGAYHVSGTGGIGTSGDFLVRGGPGTNGSGYSSLAHGGSGGNSFFGGGAPDTGTGAGAGSVDGTAGDNYGGGGSGASTNAGGSAKTGGAGASGIVIVELYA